MSVNKLNFKWGLSLVLAGLLVGAGIATFKDSSKRQIASVDGQQSFKAPKVNIWGHTPYGKMNQNIEVKVESINGIPDNDEQELRLVAHVTLNRPVDEELIYRWVLPEGASIVSGEIEDSWPGIQSGQTASTEIALVGVSKEGLAKTVTLQVSGKSKSVKYASSGSFTTDPRSLVETENSEELALKKKMNIEKMEKAHQ